jgi:N-acetylmuramic acid 6-phosphate etherase
MVDLQAVNKKLVQRSENILSQLTGRSRDEVRDALLRAEGSVKLALLLLEGCGPDEARGILYRSGGRLRPAKALAERQRASQQQ